MPSYGGGDEGLHSHHRSGDRRAVLYASLLILVPYLVESGKGGVLVRGNT
jgi:hypothetical protein